MSLKLYSHPLASYCWKVLIALYENETPFEAVMINLADPVAAAAFKRLWPIGKFPVLRDDACDRTIPEASIIIEYLAEHHPGAVDLIPKDPDRARETRLRDRFYDLYVHEPMQKIVLDKLRPTGSQDAFGVNQARAQLETSYSMLEDHMKDRAWATGEVFSMADCAAAPALHYANRIVPLGTQHSHVKAYLERLEQRASFSRVLREAEPYFRLFPG
jgi:glutathione S-transferase